MKRAIGSIIICVYLLIGSSISHAGGVVRAIQHSGKVVVHSTQGILYGVVGGVQLVSGVMAVPLALGASVGKASGQVGEKMWDAATMPIGTPLEISEEAATIGPPPDQILNNDNTTEI